jgi:hypothetical protein
MTWRFAWLAGVGLLVGAGSGHSGTYGRIYLRDRTPQPQRAVQVDLFHYADTTFQYQTGGPFFYWSEVDGAWVSDWILYWDAIPDPVNCSVYVTYLCANQTRQDFQAYPLRIKFVGWFESGGEPGFPARMVFDLDRYSLPETHTFEVASAIQNNGVVVFEFSVVNDGRLKSIRSFTMYAGSPPRVWTYDLDCGDLPRYRVGLYAPSGPDDVMWNGPPTYWPENSPQYHFQQVNVAIGDREGFNVGDKTALRSLPPLAELQLQELRAIRSELESQSSSGSAGGSSTLDAALSELRGKPTNQVEKVQQFAGAAAAAAPVFAAASNLVGDVSATFRGDLSDSVPVVGSVAWEPWVFALGPYTLDISPSRRIGALSGNWMSTLRTLVWAAAMFFWLVWSIKEAWDAIHGALIVEPMRAGLADLLGPVGAPLRIIAVGLLLFVLTVVQAAVLAALAGASGPFGYLWGWTWPAAGGTTAGNWWSLINQIVPLREVLLVAGNSLIAMLWLRAVATAIAASRFVAGAVTGAS